MASNSRGMNVESSLRKIPSALIGAAKVLLLLALCLPSEGRLEFTSRRGIGELVLCAPTEHHISQSFTRAFPQLLDRHLKSRTSLLRTLTPTGHFALEIETQGSRKHLVPPDGHEIVMASLSPSGRRAAFMVALNKPSSSLRVWDMGTAGFTDIELPAEIETYAWSPNSKFIAALTNAGVFLLKLDPNTEKVTALSETNGSTNIAWSPDSGDLTVVDKLTGRWKTFSIHGRVVSGGLQSALRGDVDVSTSTCQGRLVVVSTDKYQRSHLLLVSLRSGSRRELFATAHRVFAPTWWTQRSIVFETERGTRRPLCELTLPSNHVKVRMETGVNDIVQGSNARRNGLLYFHASVTNKELCRLTNGTQICWPVSSHAVPFHAIFRKEELHAKDVGTQEPSFLYSWCGGHTPSFAILRVHGRLGQELPILDDNIRGQLALNGCLVALAFNDRHVVDHSSFSVERQTIIDDINQGNQFIRRMLGVKSDHTYLEGFSAGTDFAIDAVKEGRMKFRSLILVAPTSESIDTQGQIRSDGATTKAMVFSPKTPLLNENRLVRRLAAAGISDVRWRSLDDSHAIFHPTSWLAIDEAIAADLDTGCKQDAGK